MKKIFNEENVTALAIVFVGATLAIALSSTVIGWFHAAKAKVTGN